MDNHDSSIVKKSPRNLKGGFEDTIQPLACVSAANTLPQPSFRATSGMKRHYTIRLQDIVIWLGRYRSFFGLAGEE